MLNIKFTGKKSNVSIRLKKKNQENKEMEKILQFWFCLSFYHELLIYFFFFKEVLDTFIYVVLSFKMNYEIKHNNINILFHNHGVYQRNRLRSQLMIWNVMSSKPTGDFKILISRLSNFKCNLWPKIKRFEKFKTVIIV